MENECKTYEISDEDLRAALGDMKSYIDVTEEDLKKIYLAALRHAKERLASGIPVRDVMTEDVITIGPDADLGAVSKLLAGNRISGLPVADKNNRVMGVITEADVLVMAGVKAGHTFRDIIRHLAGEPLPERGESGKVRDFMTSPAISTGPDTDIREAARILNEKRIKRLPVVGGDGRLIGIVSRADIVRAFVRK